MKADRIIAPVSLTAVAVLVIVGVAAIPQQGMPFAYVNAEAILQQTPGYAVAESTFNAELASFEVEVQQLQATFDSAVAQFNQQEPMLSPTARDQRVSELRQMQQQAELRQQQLTSLAQERQAELMAPLEGRIQDVIDGVRAERNIGVVFNRETPINFIISADPMLDLTDLVVQRLNSGGP